MLSGVPRLLEGHCPWWPGLPLYLLKLATEVPLRLFVCVLYHLHHAQVDFTSEKQCFSTFINETAEFYCLKDKTGAR